MEEQTFEVDRDFLLSAASWQDDLLQNYRHLSLSIQTLLMAIGVGLFVAAFALKESGPATLMTGLLLSLAVGSLILLKTTTRIVDHRGTDVDYWHSQLIKLEIVARRPWFTEFKFVQQLHRSDSAEFLQFGEPGSMGFERALRTRSEELAMGLRQPNIDLDASITDLIGKDKGHTRTVLDLWLPGTMNLAWLALAVGALYRAIDLNTCI